MDAGPEPTTVPIDDPWAPLVLSLGTYHLLHAFLCLTISDGGGVRGLSSLYILREIMRSIKVLDDADEEVNRIESTYSMPLPCNYFDFIVGTSTGGYVPITLEIAVPKASLANAFKLNQHYVRKAPNGC
jgi:patatin-like phospholipase/acyl hydrolase